MPKDNELRRWLKRVAVSQAILVAAVTFAFWLLQQQQEQFSAEQQARALAVCESTATGRATQMIFGEIIIQASTDGDDVDPARQRRIDEFRRLLADRMLGRLPATCDGIMTLSEFRDRVRLEADVESPVTDAAAALR